MTELRRGVYPLIDIGVLAVGLGGIYASVPALSQLYSDPVVDTFCLILVACALIAFFGVTIPRFWPLEIAGKLLIFGGLVLYELTLIAIIVGLVPARDPDNRIYLLGGVFVVIVVISWRLFKLIPVWTASIKERWTRDLIQDEAR